MQKGRLFYDAYTGRMDILFDDGHLHGGLHCGETFDVFLNNQWIPTRIEMSDDWYLVGVKPESLPGLEVRMR